jgi:alkylhydroperoxidase/carboxymuconolactone decarboxylase family protein YurZ
VSRREEFLRRLALNEEGVLEDVLGAGLDAGAGGLDDKTLALSRLAALIALDSATASYQWGVAAAHAAGATDDEIVAVLAAVSPIVGAARTTAAAPELAVAIGEEIDVPGIP